MINYKNMTNIIDAMKWRYSVNKFDTSKKLTDAQFDELMQAVILTPSSFGLQAWKFIAVKNPEIRSKLAAAGWNQPKFTEASHLIIFAVNKVIDDKLVDTYMASVAKTRGVAVENLKGYADMIKGSIAGRTAEQRVEWATKQAYIALGVLVTAGAVNGIDIGPMEGFDPKQFDEILGLEKLGLESKIAAAVGFRASDDPHALDKKVRYSKEEVVIEI